eukprot:g1335.t1
MTSQVEDEQEELRKAGLNAEEQRKASENTILEEARKSLNEKRKKRERGRQQKQAIVDEFEEDDSDGSNDDTQEVWNTILAFIESESNDANNKNRIIGKNYLKLYEKFKILREGGSKKLQIISDFDRTISKYYLEDGKTKGESCHGVLKHCDLPNFAEQAQVLFEKYYPMEISTELSLEDRIKACEEWWGANHGLLIELGLTKTKMKRAVDLSSNEIILRGGYKEWVDFLEERDVPLLIFSAGLADVIEEFLKKLNYNNTNVKILSNKMTFDVDTDRLVGFNENLIHSFNKGLIAFKDLNNIIDLERKNIILVGDSEGDVKMAEGIDANVVFKIGYLNQNEENLLDKYMEIYDLVLLNDPDMRFVDMFTKKVCME